MIKNNVVKTERLDIYPLSDNEIENMIVIELDMDMKKAYSEMLDGCNVYGNLKVVLPIVS